MRIIWTLLIFILFGEFAYSQIKPKLYRSRYIFSTEIPGDVEGTPFFKDKWFFGEMTTSLDTVYDELKMRYNLKLDRFEVNFEGKTFAMDKENCKKIHFTYTKKGKTEDYTFQNRVINNSLDYYQVLYESDNIKYLRTFKSHVKENTYHQLGIKRDKDTYEVIEQRFIAYRNRLTEVRANKKSI